MNLEAVARLGGLYDAMKAGGYPEDDLPMFLVRVLFCLFAEDILTGPERGREAKLEAFHNKLAALNFFDPACGCGNFLIITYREIRKLEIQVLKALHPHGQLVTDVSLLSKVRVSQFHGIEIEEFPAQIARVAMCLK